MTGSKRSMDPVEGAAQAGLELAQHLAVVIAARTAAPSDDVISVLVRAQEGEVLTALEAIGFAGVLTFAGTETTTNLIGNAVRALVETLRWDSPVQYLFRRATAPTEIAAVRVEENALSACSSGPPTGTRSASGRTPKSSISAARRVVTWASGSARTSAWGRLRTFPSSHPSSPRRGVDAAARSVTRARTPTENGVDPRAWALTRAMTMSCHP
jgi:hypothetical protein